MLQSVPRIYNNKLNFPPFGFFCLPPTLPMTHLADFLDYPIHRDIVYFDYVQRSCSSLYRLLRFTNCPTYITF